MRGRMVGVVEQHEESIEPVETRAEQSAQPHSVHREYAAVCAVSARRQQQKELYDDER